MKRTQKLIGLFFALILVLGLSVTAMAAESPYGVRADSVAAGDLTLTVDNNGVLTWTDVPGATSYDLNVRMKGGLVKSETGLTVTSYELEAMLDGYKKDSGTVEVTINVWGGSGQGGSANFLYASPYPKLEAPTNLRWDVNGNPDWDDVANADGYTIYLYQPSGGAFNHYDLGDTSYFACTNYPEVATRVSDGWYFTVRATSTGDYRPSEYNESYRRGHIVGSGLRAESQQILTVNENGTLLWNSVPGATSYDLSIWTKDGLFMAENGLTQCSYSLQEKLNAYKKDSGTIMVSLSPKGSNVSSHGGTEYFMYSSPYGKLEAPSNLYWNGNMAGWSAVDGAESYTVYLYQPSGSGYNHWTTTDTYFDFSSVATIGEDWFFAVKATASNARDSVYNESPRYTGPASTTLYTIGAYAYDGTNGVMDSGGQVYLETNVGVVDWTSSGETMSAIEGTAVTVKAAPTPGYVFVEWRQGTQGATISREAEYSFTATGDKFLYAIFRDKDDNEIAEVVGKIASENIPRAGMEVSHFMPDIPDGEPYSRTWNGSEWRDENGVLISANIGHHYDRGYEFEAGRSYTTDYFYFEANSGYTFAEDATVHLMGPERSMWDYEVTGFNNDRTIMFVRFTFRIPGDRTYPDINKVSMVYYGTPRDGDAQPDAAKLIYNNCAITREEWNTGSWGNACTWDTSTGKNRFEAGNTYVHMIELTALPGYKFSENLLAQKGMQGEEEYGVVSLSDDRTVATVTYTYNVSDLDAINTVTLDTKAGNEDFYLIRGGDNSTSGLPFTTSYTQQNAPYEIRFSNYYEWYDVETEKEIDSIASIDLEVGKKYRLEFELVIKDEYETTCRFADSPTLVLNDYQQAHASFVDIETEAHSGGTHLKVYITYTVQPKPGEGSGSYYPMVCYSYDEFKYAMESPDIRYVALGNVEDMLPMIPHDEEKEPDGITRTAIVVRGHKDLNLLGNAVFRCPLTGNYDLKYYIQLLTLTDAADSSLYIHGNGSLTYEGGTLYFVNSAITVDGGHLTVDGATVRGSNGYHTGYCYGINARRGSVSIQNGATIIGEVYGGDDGICAMAVGEEGEYRSLSVSIWDGKFYVERDTGDGSVDHGITVWNDCGLRIYGMTSDGIKLGRYAADTLDDYVMDGCAMTVNGVKTDPATCDTINGYVEVYTEISEVEIYVETPVAGESATVYPEEVYWVPEGCTVESIVWYENGEALNLAYAPHFEAGRTYRVEVTLVADNGVRFADPLTSAEISYKTATVNAHGGNAKKGIVMSVDFGACPNVVPQVELTVTAPMEGSTPSYGIGCGSDAYYAVGGSSNYTDYRQWYMSSDNDDWWEINGTHSFMSGYYYKLYVDIRTNEGYEFPLIDTGTIQPNVTATVNGYSANVIKAYEQDPSRYITVEYNFGECVDSVVEKITAENVTAPVAGQKPDYNWSVRGTGYHMNTAKNNETYGVRNGMQWWTGDWDYVFPTDTFVPGETYICQLNLVADTANGFRFRNMSEHDALPTATINGNTAEINEGWTNMSEARIYYTFTCAEQTVSTITLSDLDAPVGGQVPDTDITSGDPTLYTVERVTWTDVEEGTVDDVFESGIPYQVEIVVAAVQAGGVDMVQFADANALTILVNGSQISYLTPVTVEDNKVTIQYTFRNPAAAPEIELYTFTTQPVGGEVMAGEAHNTAWETNFLPTSNEIQYWDGEAWDQWDVQTPQNALDDYDFESVDHATHRFRIAAYVGDEIVATSNEFVITWNCAHTGGTATCTAQAVCTECGQSYGELNSSNHTGTAQWTADADTHSKAYTCCDAVVIPNEVHEWNNGVCSECGYNCTHTGGTATCTAKAVCTTCGSPYGAMNGSNHTGTADWIKTATHHSKEYTCCHAVVVPQEEHDWTGSVCGECGYGCTHTGGTATCTAKAVCTACGNPYGALNAANHSGIAQWTKTATHHSKEYTCCHAVVIPNEIHEWNNGVCSECGYNCTHTGGTATCTAKAVCTTCGSPYGALNGSNHTGTAEWTKTATHHSKAYTCCHAVVVPQEEHDWNGGVCSDCGYGCTHTGGTATCTAKAVCTACGNPYGALNPSNHTGTAEWTKTATHHSKEYTCCHAVVVPQEEHKWNGGVCSDCGYGCTHTGGTATCTAKAVCTACGNPYGALNPSNHTGTAEWTKTATHHSKAYTCCHAVVVPQEAHEWNGNTCSECLYSSGAANVDQKPTAANVTYAPNGKLSASVLTGGKVTNAGDTPISGTWAWAEPNTLLYAGTASYTAIFTPAVSGIDSVQTTVEVTVTPAAQTLTSIHGSPEAICTFYAGPGLEMRDMVSSNMNVSPVFVITEDEGEAYVEGTVLYSPDAGFVTVEAQFPGVDVNGDGTHEYAPGSVEIHTKFTTVPMFRMYDPNAGEHFYTGSELERDTLVTAGWNYEGVGFNYPAIGAPVYRLYNPVSGDHLYTMDEAEIAQKTAGDWHVEGVAFNSAPDTEVAQYRLWNPNAVRGAWHFTSDAGERAMLISVGWQDQGIGWYSTLK